MKFALQVKDEDFEQAEQILGTFYDDKSEILIYDPLTGEPPAGKFVLIAISDVWLPKYSDRISGYIANINEISSIVDTVDGFSLHKDKSDFDFSNFDKTKKDDLAKTLEKNAKEISDNNFDNNFLDILQDGDVQDFFVESSEPNFQKIEPKGDNLNDFSFAENDSELRVSSSSAVFSENSKETKQTPSNINKEIKKEKQNVNSEIKRYYLSDSDTSYAVAVSIHIKYSSKIIAVVDDKLFQKYGDLLDENVYIFKSFKDVSESSLPNYVLIITAKDKAQDKDISKYSKNPIAYWEEINNLLDKIHS